MPGKDTFYRFLNAPNFAWDRFLLKLSGKVIGCFTKLTSSNRVKVLIVDDSLYKRSRSKCVELLAWIHDHTTGKSVKGFNLLTIGWSDGFSFVPAMFSLLSSLNKKCQVQGMQSSIDKRTLGYKRRMESLQKKPERVTARVEKILSLGIHAQYILMDSWFTNEPMLTSMKQLGLNVIGMIKNVKQVYKYQGKWYRLETLYAMLYKSGKKQIFGSVVVQTKTGISAKLVFVRNRNKKSEWLTVLSTDTSISDDEVIRIYGIRWHIEVFFKAIKSFLRLGSEFQGRSYAMLVSHTTIVFTRYILLEMERRNHSDERSWGDLFYLMCDEVKDVDFKEALSTLLALFEEVKNRTTGTITKFIKEQLNNWIASQPAYIRILVGLKMCES